MTAVLEWADSQEGVSDLRRFWHGRAIDFSIDELMAFHATLPETSATARAVSGSNTAIDIVLLATMVDSVRQLAFSMAGKRMPKEQLLAPAFVGEQGRQEVEILKARVREQRKNVGSDIHSHGPPVHWT